MVTFLLYPRSAYQLWVPESHDEGVCSLVMINAEFALHENEVDFKSGLLFAGRYDGQISLVSGKGKNKISYSFKVLLVSV